MLRKAKLFGLISCLLLCLMTAAVSAELAESVSGSCGSGVIWVLDTGGTLTISGQGKMNDYAYGNLAPWFDYRSDIKRVVVESGVTQVGDMAFHALRELIYASIGDGVKNIGETAFNNCNKLKRVDLADSISTIESFAFAGCSALVGIDIPKSVLGLNQGTFHGCTSMKTVIISKNLGYVQALAFNGCTGIAKVHYEGTSKTNIALLGGGEGNTYFFNASWEYMSTPELPHSWGVWKYLDEDSHGRVCSECGREEVGAHDWMDHNCGKCFYRQEYADIVCCRINARFNDLPVGAHLMMAAYAADGRMIDLVTRKWFGSTENTFRFETLEAAEKVRLFILDKNFVPVREIVVLDEAAGNSHDFRLDSMISAKCETDGKRHFVCANCADEYTEIIPATGHDWSIADCTNPESCGNCSQTRNEALGHDFKQGSCGRCGLKIATSENLAFNYLAGMIVETGAEYGESYLVTREFDTYNYHLEYSITDQTLKLSQLPVGGTMEGIVTLTIPASMVKPFHLYVRAEGTGGSGYGTLYVNPAIYDVGNDSLEFHSYKGGSDLKAILMDWAMVSLDTMLADTITELASGGYGLEDIGFGRFMAQTEDTSSRAIMGKKLWDRIWKSGSAEGDARTVKMEIKDGKYTTTVAFSVNRNWPDEIRMTLSTRGYPEVTMVALRYYINGHQTEPQIRYDYSNIDALTSYTAYAPFDCSIYTDDTALQFALADGVYGNTTGYQIYARAATKAAIAWWDKLAQGTNIALRDIGFDAYPKR